MDQKVYYSENNNYYHKYVKYKLKYSKIHNGKQSNGYDHTNSKDTIKYLNCMVNGLQCDDA